MYKPVEVDDIFVDALEDLVETCQYLNVVLTELFIEILQLLEGWEGAGYVH